MGARIDAVETQVVRVSARWFGLAMVLFLVIVGISDSLLAFNPQFTRLLIRCCSEFRPSRVPIS